MVKLIINTTEFDLTDYVDEGSIAYSDNIDETFANGGFVIPFIKPNTMAGVDFSKPLPQLSKVYIEVDGEGYYWKVSEDKVVKVRKGTNPLYEHTVSLIEPTVDLTKRVLPDMTITQPKGTLDGFVYALHQLSDTGKETIIEIPSSVFVSMNTSAESQGLKIQNTPVTLAFNYGTSNDTAIINQNVLKTVRDYTIEATLKVYNTQYLSGQITSPATQIEVEIYSGATKIGDYSFDMNEANVSGFIPQYLNPFERLIKISLDYTSLAVDEVITVKAYTTGSASVNDEDSLYIIDGGLNLITYSETAETPKYYLDNVVDKILTIAKQSPITAPYQEYVLDSETRQRIKDTLSPEFKFEGYTIFEALQEIASYVGAIAYMEDYTTVKFMFYDDPLIESEIEYIDEEQNAFLNDYVTGFELNARNVIKEDDPRYAQYEPSPTGWLTVRGQGIGQIDDNNATLYLSKGVYKPFSLIVKGLAFYMKNTGINVNFAANVEWDITEYLVEQTKWQALVNTSSANARSNVLNKGNSIYYVQGDNKVYSIGYNDVILAPGWNTATPANYAIVEAILCKAQSLNPTYTFDADYTPAINIFSLQFRLTHMAYSNARVTVYRDDAASLYESTKYFNEQANINDMKTLGDIVKKHVNRRGNIVTSYRGVAKNINNLIRLGMRNSRGEVLSSYAVSITPTLREFVLHYSKDNPNINSNKGVPSAYRQYEVPTNDFVYRKDKYTEFVYLSEIVEPSVFTIYSTTQLLENFQPTPTGTKLNYAQVDIDYTGNGTFDKTVEATVDTLAFGNTLALQVEMLDNYSAGAKQETGTVVGNVTARFQTDVRYTDDLGRFEVARVKLFATHNPSNPDLYPENADSVSGAESTLSIRVKKDAREIWGLTQELVFRSNYTNIKVYSGMAKFNGLAMKGTEVETAPFLLKSGYFPLNESIDRSQLVQVAWTSNLNANELETIFTTPVGNYGGYIWMEVGTWTPIFAVQTTEFDTGVGATLSHSVFIYTSYSILIPSYVESLSSELTVLDTMGVVKYVFPREDLTSTMTVEDMMTLIRSTDYAVNESSIMYVNDTMTVEQSYNLVDNLSSSLTVSDVISVEISTNIIDDISSIIYVLDDITVAQFIFPIVDISDSLSMDVSMNDEQSTTYWHYIGTTNATFDSAVTNIGEGSTCNTETTIRAWLTSMYPPSSYAYGTVFRVLVANEDLELCTPRYHYYSAS